MIRIAIAGDVCAGGINEEFFRRGDADALFGGAKALLHEADLSIVNLESPLYSKPRGIQKSGSVLGVPDECVRGLVAGGMRIVGLANNHAMDHSSEGLENTIRVCRENGISTVGAGRDLAAARRIHVRMVGGLRIGVLGMTEHEFGVARRNRPGVNPLNPIDWVRNVRAHRADFDFLIVLLHGGNEYLQIPRPSLVETCRFFIEEGADIVLCQHSHCIGCIEAYRAGHIVYGQGNFIFDSPGANSLWLEGGVVVLEIDPDGRSSLDFVPVRQTPGRPGAQLMDGEERDAVLRSIEQRSRVLADPEALDAHWLGFCNENKELYLRRLGAKHRLGRGIDRLTGNVQSSYKRSWSLRAEHLNLIRCESHRETLIQILSEGFE